MNEEEQPKPKRKRKDSRTCGGDLFRRRVKMCELQLEGLTIKQSAQEAGLGDAPYYHQKMSKDILKKLTERTLQQSSRSFIAKKEELYQILSDIARNSESNADRVRAAKTVLDDMQKTGDLMHKHNQELNTSSPESTTPSIQIYLPDQNQESTEV